MEIALAIISLVVLFAGLIFWGRGILKSRKDDIVFGFSIIAVICVLSLITSASSAAFGGIGVILLMFGAENLVLSPFAKLDCPVKKQERVGLGIASIVIGVLLGLII